MSYMPTAHLIMFKGDVRGYIFYPPFTHMLGFLYTFHFYILQLLSTLGFTSLALQRFGIATTSLFNHAYIYTQWRSTSIFRSTENSK